MPCLLDSHHPKRNAITVRQRENISCGVETCTREPQHSCHSLLLVGVVGCAHEYLFPAGLKRKKLFERAATLNILSAFEVMHNDILWFLAQGRGLSFKTPFTYQELWKYFHCSTRQKRHISEMANDRMVRWGKHPLHGHSIGLSGSGAAGLTCWGESPLFLVFYTIQISFVGLTAKSQSRGRFRCFNLPWSYQHYDIAVTHLTLLTKGHPPSSL